MYRQRDEDEERLSKKEPIYKYTEEQVFAEEFGWYPMLYAAAKEDYLNIEKVLQTPANEFLTFVNFYIRKSELDANRIRKSR